MCNAMHRHRHQGGFTLLELMVVLTIVGFLLTIVAPRFSAALPGVQFKHDSAQFAATLRLARSRAIERQLEVVVMFNAKDRTYKIEGTGVGGHFSTGSEFFQDGRSISNTSDPERRFTFFANGTASETELEVRRAGTVVRIQVQWLTGGVSIVPTS